MASQFESIAALVSDDTGTPEAPNGDGTQINLSFFEAVDAILNEFITRDSKVVGGVWTWETFGQHKMEAGGTGEQSLLVRNTTPGNSNRAAVTVQANGTSLVQLQMFSTTFTPNSSGSISSDGARLVHTGGGLFAFETVDTDGFKFFPAGAERVTIDFTNGAVALNQFGWSIKNTAGAVIPGVIIDSANEMIIGSDDPDAMNETVVKSGRGVRFRVNEAPRGLIDDTNPELSLGVTALGTFQTMQLGSGAGTPVSAQILFGTDNTGWQLRIGKNHAGSVTHLWKVSDAGHFSPVANNSYDFGTSTEKVKALWVTDIDVTTSCSPNADNTGTLGSSGKRWQNLYCMNAFVNDLHFDNGWSFTEHDKLDIDIPGIALVDDEGELQLFIGKNKRIYMHTQDYIERIKYTRRTREERAAL